MRVCTQRTLRVNQNLSSNLTKEFSSPRYKKLSKEQRKLANIKALCERGRVTFSAIFAKNNMAWARESESEMLRLFYMLERRIDFLNPLGE